MKRYLSLILTLCLSFALLLPAQAASGQSVAEGVYSRGVVSVTASGLDANTRYSVVSVTGEEGMIAFGGVTSDSTGALSLQITTGALDSSKTYQVNVYEDATGILLVTGPVTFGGNSSSDSSGDSGSTGGSGTTGGTTTGGTTTGGTTTPTDEVTTTVVTNPDGTSTVTTETAGGTIAVAMLDDEGLLISAQAELSEEDVAAAAEAGVALALALPDIPVTPVAQSEDAPAITITAPEGAEVPVMLSLEDGAGSGVVALLVVHEDGTEEILRDSVVTEDGKLLLTVSGTVTIKVVDNSIAFDDVPDGHWAKDDINFVAARQLLNGVGGGKFAPDMTVTRGMVATVLHNLNGNPYYPFTGIFPDVAESAYYATAIQWAAETGVLKGYDTGLAGPEDPVTREQLAVLLWRYAGSPASDQDLSSFADEEKVAGWAEDGMRWAVEVGILKGNEKKELMPGENASRAELAAMMRRFCGVLATM